MYTNRLSTIDLSEERYATESRLLVHVPTYVHITGGREDACVRAFVRVSTTYAGNQIHLAGDLIGYT